MRQAHRCRDEPASERAAGAERALDASTMHHLHGWCARLGHVFTPTRPKAARVLAAHLGRLARLGLGGRRHTALGQHHGGCRCMQLVRSDQRVDGQVGAQVTGQHHERGAGDARRDKAQSVGGAVLLWNGHHLRTYRQARACMPRLGLLHVGRCLQACTLLASRCVGSRAHARPGHEGQPLVCRSLCRYLRARQGACIAESRLEHGWGPCGMLCSSEPTSQAGRSGLA